MNIVAEHKISGEPIDNDKAPKRPVKPVRWFLIVGVLLGALVGGLVWFNSFRGQMIKQFFANNKPPPVSVSAAEAKSEGVPNLLTGVGELVAGRLGGRCREPPPTVNRWLTPYRRGCSLKLLHCLSRGR